MNVAMICGNLTKDPDVRETQSGMKVARYILAVNRRGKDEADFIPCVVFDKGAEFAEKYLKKGSRIIVRGRITTGSYNDKDGKRIYTTDITVDDQEFAGPKSEETDDDKEEKRRKNYEKSKKKDDDDFVSIPDDVDDSGLPFM